jgi:hypothetical protein
MRMHTLMHVTSRRISISRPHIRPCGRILKQCLRDLQNRRKKIKVAKIEMVKSTKDRARDEVTSIKANPRAKSHCINNLSMNNLIIVHLFSN